MGVNVVHPTGASMGWGATSKKHVFDVLKNREVYYSRATVFGRVQALSRQYPDLVKRVQLGRYMIAEQKK